MKMPEERISVFNRNLDFKKSFIVKLQFIKSNFLYIILNENGVYTCVELVCIATFLGHDLIAAYGR